MPNWTTDDADTCGCTYAKACDYHRGLQEASRGAWETLCEEKGWDPYGKVTDAAMKEILEATCNPDLSDRQRDAIWRKHFPRKVQR